MDRQETVSKHEFFRRFYADLQSWHMAIIDNAVDLAQIAEHERRLKKRYGFSSVACKMIDDISIWALTRRRGVY